LPLTVFTQRNFVADFRKSSSSKEVDFYTRSGHFPFLTPSGGLETAYDVHLRLIRQPVVDFLVPITERFSLAVTAEALRANIDGKSPFLKGWVTLVQNSDRRGNPHQPFFA